MNSKDVNTLLLVVGCAALGVLTLLAGPDTKNLGPRTRGHFMPEDFESRRADGRYESSVAWAQDMVRNMKPIYSLDTVKRPEDFPAWRAKVRAKLRELLQVPDPLPKVEFKLLKEEPRDGYRLRTYEFYPEPKLAVRMMMLVPDAAAEGKAKVPAMVSLPGSGASLESLAGEPDEYVCHFPARNRQSWFFAKMGIVGVALENPATAHNSVEGVNHFVCQAQFARLMTLAGRSNWGFVTTHVLETVAFLRSLPFVRACRLDASRRSIRQSSTRTSPPSSTTTSFRPGRRTRHPSRNGSAAAWTRGVRMASTSGSTTSRTSWPPWRRVR